MNIRKTVQQSIDYIEENLKAEITVEELCASAGYSRAHYCRLFKSFVGVSVGEYINRRKLLYAVYEMQNGQPKISIALDYGFKTYAGFYKSFRKEFKCSPSQFIKTHNGKKPYKINILQEEKIMLSKRNAQKMLAEWGLQDETISNIYNENTGSQSENSYYIGQDYILKFTANFGCVKRNISISEALEKADVKSFKIVRTVDGKSYASSGEMYFYLVKRIRGSHLKCADIFDNTDLAFETGKEIAKLHKALKTLEECGYESVNIYNHTVNSAFPKIKSTLELSDGFIERYAEEFGAVYDILPKQIIHRDINPSNILFDNGRFNGFLDFDLSEINIRIFDICYFATSVLSECFSQVGVDKIKWFEILQKTALGYDSTLRLTADEKQALPYVIYTIQIMCVEYFGKFDKYKDLEKINTDIFKWIIDNT